MYVGQFVVSIRRNKGMLVVDCDGGCGVSLPTATTSFDLLKKLKAKAGWYAIPNDAGKWQDYCAACAAGKIGASKAPIAIKATKRGTWRRCLKQLQFYGAVFGAFMLGLLVGRIIP
jgi:hypothetical protein